MQIQTYKDIDMILAWRMNGAPIEPNNGPVCSTNMSNNYCSRNVQP